MDLERWRTVEPSGNVRAAEFFRPEHMAERQVAGLGITRIEAGRFMRFSRSTSGRVFHPEGDAVPPDAISHAAASLHKYGLPATMDGALANDFDFGTDDPNYIFELYLRILKVRFDWPPFRWTGIGVYPDWKLGSEKNSGFHIDQRPLNHSTMKGRNQVQTWIQTKGEYLFPLTWSRFREAFGLAFVG